MRSAIFQSTLPPEKPQKAPPPVLGAVHELFLRPKPAAGGFRFSPLHFRAALRSATFRYIPFIVSLQPRQPTQECFHSFHFAHANPPFHSAPLWLFHPTFRNSKPKREASFHPTQFAPLHSVTTLAFPHANQRYALRSVHP